MNKNVFVWVGYGIVSVHSIETLGQVKNMLNELRETLMSYEYDEFDKIVNKVDKYLGKKEENQIEDYLKCIRHITKEVQHHDVEGFESGTGICELKNSDV